MSNSNPDSPINSPHDRFFKETFSHPELFAELAKLHLPSSLVEAVNWTSLKPEPGSFIDQHLAAGSSDLLYSVDGSAGPSLFYFLFEHQSRPDPDMAFRLLCYMVRIWEQWRKSHPGLAKLPPIIPIVLHNGKRKWDVPNQFLDHVAIPPEGKPDLALFLPSFEYLVIDLAVVPVADIDGGAILHLSLTLMKAAGEGRVDAWMRRSVELLAALVVRPERSNLLYTMMRYLFNAAPDDSSTFPELIHKIENATVRNTIMTFAEQLRQEGLEKGIEKGAVIGQIQQAQRFLRQPVAGLRTLQEKSQAELQLLLQELESSLAERLK